ncbi:SDR family NAD(P)-dependent oxidoreductase [Kineococcus radiotolerans]|uniref:Short-chain dehydrogenase/reductase SDR n=1 Tax=Kineococcus radiotolerans (strain ATCC BAA-149 / DSM 14245 / SRS30216) TaxID=266940 RepID=A6W9L9_KINRD|nr:SDR family oxidoreductase [Kineococcus radiotolerans]ABS03508.1 short-chain dehydrogenase/reductase SDR [Kineococcus radiotolerans SRS30216 = ATCC BAA-149]
MTENTSPTPPTTTRVAPAPGTTGTTRRVALVTGASRGLGRSTALHLARAGVDVVGTYLDARDAADSFVEQARAAGSRAVALRLDVADSSSFPAFAAQLPHVLRERFGRDTIDALVNNAGTALHEPFATTSEEQFTRIVDVHLKAPFFLTQALLPVIADGARIVNVSTGLVRITMPGSAAYAAAKGAVEVLTRYQAQELGARGIRVNVVAPGAVATDFSGGVVRDDPQVAEMVRSVTALGRLAGPDDIGAAIALLLADGFGWASGATIELTGGQRL